MRIRPIAAALALVLLPASMTTTLYCKSARAQGATEDAMTEAARARFREGVELYDKKQYEKARVAFLQAYTLKKHPDILFNLGQSCVRAGRTRDAEKYFSQFLRESQSPAPEKRKEAEAGRDEARARLGRIEVAAPAGTEVTVDSDAVGTTPLPENMVFVDPGAHTVKFKNGGETETQSVSVLAGQQAVARFKSASAAPAPAPVPTPKPSEPTPSPKPSEPAPSPSTDAAPVSEKRDDAPAQLPSDEGGAQKPGVFSPPSNMAPVYVGGAIALAGFGTAVVMLIVKNGAQSNADNVAAQIRNAGGHQGICSSTQPADIQKFGKACSALNDDDNAVNTDALVGNVALGVGIAATVVTGIYYLAGRKRDDTSTVTTSRPMLTPMIGPRVGGLSISGAF